MLTEKYDIIIQAGQSNAEGSGRGCVSNEKKYVPNSNILYLTSNKIVDCSTDVVEVKFSNDNLSIEIAEERIFDREIVGDFSLIFAQDYLKAGLCANDRKVLIVRCAVGGTSFAQKHWGLNDILYLKMLEMTDYALLLNPENRIVAFLWHQGESDVIHNSDAKWFSQNLASLLNGVREKYGEIPFIAGDFVHEWKNKNEDVCKPIIDEIVRVVKNNDLCSFVETDGLLSNNQKIYNGDDIHFCREALYELGHRYYEAFSRMKG